MTDLKQKDLLIKEWLEEIKTYIIEQKNEDLEVSQKTADNDLVTRMDKTIEEKLVGKIRSHFPSDKIVGEEGFGDQVDSLEGTVWFIDPIDGTLNFVKQQENFAVMIAVYTDGIPECGYVYDITQNKLYSSIKGEGVCCNGQQVQHPENLKLNEGMIASSSALMGNEKKPVIREIGRTCMGVRMRGSAGLETVEVLKGNVIAYIASNLKPWDVAPGLLFMSEMGMTASQFDGEEIDLLKDNSIIFATNNAHKEIVNMLDA
ncbi:Inositol-1-monophosphatase [Alkalibacterium sp. AK22]|uniref:inositol monophosphatase family protein n=1 Tax=Alkalibacterium sp. AK22 TaxID=1229520 RepID=UPI00044C2D28|nr:inositol monophosphatase family protein [Alkalibacterium sp. AK22]EXJ22789.1 Inositol-1-monophosphatase [Alkalibacterium sp. AK22]